MGTVPEADAEWDLLERLDAASSDSTNIHNDLCAQFDGAGTPCSCGIPRLLRDAAAFARDLAVEGVIRQARRAA